jgi:N-acetylgalactosamine 4-sulfate 6-O-sulfotransferase
MITMDASSTYISNGHFWESDKASTNLSYPTILTHHRLFRFQPDAKILLILRDPAERLFSDYNFFVHSKLKGPDQFHELVVNGIEWWTTCVSKLSEVRCAYGHKFDALNIHDLASGIFNWGMDTEGPLNGAGRLRASIYFIFFNEWLKLFPKENILVVTLEDYRSAPYSLFNDEILPFLGLEPFSRMAIKGLEQIHAEGVLNKAKKPLSMHNETKALLKDFYEPYNKRLAQLLNNEKFLWK